MGVSISIIACITYLAVIILVPLLAYLIRKLNSRQIISEKIKRLSGIIFANILTFSRLLIVIWLLFIPEISVYILFLILFVGVLSDIEDGIVARKLNGVTPAGERIDPIIDKLALGILMYKLFLMNLVPLWAFLSLIIPYIIIITIAFISAGLCYYVVKVRPIPRVPADKVGKVLAAMVISAVALMILLSSYPWWQLIFLIIATLSATISAVHYIVKGWYTYIEAKRQV